MSLCSIDGCDAQACGRGWCRMHYQRWKTHGDPLTTKRILGDVETRLWQKVDKNGPVSDFAPHLGACWIWTGTRRKGYGSFSVNSKYTYAHVFLYNHLIGPVPEGLDLDHLCRERLCVKVVADEFGPAHLEPVTRSENIRRGLLGELRTECPHGHPYDELNTYRSPRGHRQCRQCHREAEARRKREAA